MEIDSLTYIINLQRAIEYHCMGLLVPDNVMSECPHHAEMLNLQLSRQQQQESCPTIEAAPPHAHLASELTNEQLEYLLTLGKSG